MNNPISQRQATTCDKDFVLEHVAGQLQGLYGSISAKYNLSCPTDEWEACYQCYHGRRVWFLHDLVHVLQVVSRCMSKYLFTAPETSGAGESWTDGELQAIAMSLATAIFISCIMIFHFLLAVETKKHVYSHAANRLGARWQEVDSMELLK